MGERERRIGENEALFRQVNERIKELNRGFSAVLERGDYLCECGDEACIERVSLTPEEYERVRSEPTDFVVNAANRSTTAACKTRGPDVLSQRRCSRTSK